MPAAACIQFALQVPGVRSIALNTTEVKRVKENLEMAENDLPLEFWEALTINGLIHTNAVSNLLINMNK